MINRLDHVSLSTKDIKKSIAFYQDMLGMKLDFQEEAQGKQFETIFGLPPGFRAKVAQFEEGLEISQFIAPPGRDLHVTTWDYGVMFLIFDVSGLDKMYNDLVSKGVRFFNPPITLKSPLKAGGSLKIAHCEGPDGERISLREHIKG